MRLCNDKALRGGEPEFSVAGAPTCRLIGLKGSLAALHPIVGSIMYSPYCRHPARRKFVQITPICHINSARCADPEIAFIVVKNTCQKIVEESALHPIVGHTPIDKAEPCEPLSDEGRTLRRSFD